MSARENRTAACIASLAAICVASACGSSSGSSSAPGEDGSAPDGAVDAQRDGSGTSDSSSSGGRDASRGDGAPGDSPSGVGLAGNYPCDKGLANDPAVLWLEDFEEGSVSAVTSRYDAANDPAGMALVTDVPGRSCGKASMKLTSGTSAPATDLYKEIVPGHDEWFVRWYAKYQAGIQWHHTGMWINGYEPPTPYANPQAGNKPVGDDRFSIAIEPVWGIGQPNPRLDHYDYWMNMHSWMAQPTGNGSYYGNSVVHQNAFTADDDTWICLELHVKLNTDPSSSAGAAIDVWKNDVLVQHLDGQMPLGCWIADKFCPVGADGAECTDYPNLCAQPYVPIDLQLRSTTALQLNAFWPQNYITAGPDGSVQFDDMVVATSRVGCLTPAQ